MPHHLKHLGKRKTMESFPSGKGTAIRGAIRFYEGQVDDARHTMMLARTAAQFGALCANSTRAVGFLREGDHVVGVHAKDLEGGREFEIRAQQVINAAGVWTDEIQEMVGGRGQFRVRASKGVHIVVPRNRINSATGIIARTAKSVLFIVPWGSHWIIGTTDTDWKLDLAHPAASQNDIDYLLEQANRLLADPLTREDVVGVYAGLRPLLAGESDSTSQALPRACGRQPGARADRDRRRQVHDLPGDGQGRRRLRRPRHGAQACRPRSPRTCRWSAPTATTRCGTRGGCSRRAPACGSAWSSTCSAATARWSTSCST